MNSYQPDLFEIQTVEDANRENVNNENEEEVEGQQNETIASNSKVERNIRSSTYSTPRSLSNRATPDLYNISVTQMMGNGNSHSKKNTQPPFVTLVDISRPMRVKRGKGDPVEDPVFVNISFPVSITLPGISNKDCETSREHLEDNRWVFLKNTTKTNNIGAEMPLDECTSYNVEFPDWFNPNEISSVEQNFLTTIIPDCKEYLYIRNVMIRSYFELPQIRLSVSSVASKLSSHNILHIAQVHAFLQDWGMVNTDPYTSPLTCLTSSYVKLLRKFLFAQSCKQVESEGKETDDLLISSYNNDKAPLVYDSPFNYMKQPNPSYAFQSQRIAERCKNAKITLQETDSVSVSRDENIQNPDTENFKCFMCLRDCIFIAYQHLDLPIIICPSCFKDGKFAMNTPSSTFRCLRITSTDDLNEDKTLTNCGKECDDNCNLQEDEWDDLTTLQLLCTLEKGDDFDWNEVSKVLKSLILSNSKMSLRKSSPPTHDDRLRTCRRYFKRKSFKMQGPPNLPIKKQKSSELGPANCVQRFLSLHYPDSILDDLATKKSLLESSQNLVMTLLSTIHRTFGGEIAAAGAKKGLEYLSVYVKKKYKEDCGNCSLDDSLPSGNPNQSLDILEHPPDENLIYNIAVEVLKGSAEEARVIAKWEDMAAELLVQQIIDLECKKISCKTKLIELLDQG